MQKEAQFEKTIDSSLENLAVALDFIQEHATSVSDSEVLPLTMRLLAEEAISNIMRHGYRNRKGPITIKSSSSESDFTIELQDEGTPFDPTHPSDSIGLHLLHAIADSMEYRHENNMNILKLKKLLTS